MQKFILGLNPNAPETSGTWVIHLPPPQLIIEVVKPGEKTHLKGDDVISQQFDLLAGKVELRAKRGADEAHTISTIRRAYHWYAHYVNQFQQMNKKK